MKLQLCYKCKFRDLCSDVEKVIKFFKSKYSMHEDDALLLYRWMCYSGFKKIKFIKEMNSKKEGYSAKDLIAFYCDEFKKKFSQYEYARPRVDAKDAGAIKTLMKEYDVDTIKRFIVGFLNIQDDFLSKVGYKLHFLPGHVNRLLIGMSKGERPVLSKNQILTFIDAYNSGKWNPGEEGDKTTKMYMQYVRQYGLEGMIKK